MEKEKHLLTLNIAYPAKGSTLKFGIDDTKVVSTIAATKCRLGQEVAGEIFDEKFRGCTLRLTGGNDKQGFPMRLGVQTDSRVKLLLSPGQVGYSVWRARAGERRRKAVRGAIFGADIAAVNLTLVRPGPTPIEGLTDVEVPRRLFPKRASKIRRLFDRKKEEDIRKFVQKRVVPAREAQEAQEGKKAKPAKKEHYRKPKVQRLVTPRTLRRIRAKRSDMKARWRKASTERAAYEQVLHHMMETNQQRRRARVRRVAIAKARTA